MKIKGLLFFLGMAVGFLGYAVAEEQPSQIELRDDGIYENGLWLAPLPAASEAEKPELFMPDMWFTYGTTFNAGSGYSQGTMYLANSFNPAYFGQSYPFNITEVRARIWNNSGATDQVQFSIYPGTSTTPVYTSPLINVPTGSSTWLNHPLTSPVPISSGTFMVSFIYYGTSYTYLWYNTVAAPNGHGYSRPVTSPTWTWLNTRDWSIGAYVISGGPTNTDMQMLSLFLTGIQPAPNQVWCGATYTPYDTIINNGSVTANTITTTSYIGAWSNSQPLGSLASGTKARNNFTSWTASLTPGAIQNRRDTTYAALPFDPNLANNKVATNYTAVYDGETVSIDSPPLAVVVGNTYPIQATVKNNSPTGAASFAVSCTLGTSPAIIGIQTVTNLAAGASTQVTFFNYTVPPGTIWPLTVVCQMNGDVNTANNTKSIIFGTIADVQMKPNSLFLSGNLTGLGAGQVWCGAPYTPRDTVFNNGPIPASTITTLSFFDASPALTGSAIPLLASGAQQEVSFPSWTASLIPNTSHSRRDTTFLASPIDPDLTNNKRTATYTAMYDGQAVSINSPPTNPWCGATYTPSATVRNNSAAGAATFTVTCTINPGGYSDTRTVTNLAAGTNTNVNFANWLAPQAPNSGPYTVTVTCNTTGDVNTANNSVSINMTTVYDGQTVSIDDPPAQVWCGSTRVPKATVKNNSALGAATFTVTCTITGGYSSTKTVSSLAAGATIQVTFDNWLVSRSPNTVYTVTVTCQTTGDNNTANNTQTSTTTSVYDGQTVSIDSPPTNPWCGADYQPQATVKNNSPEGAADFSVTCTINPGYSNTQAVTNLAAGATRQISFASWIASNVPNTSYTVTVTCQTTGDVNAANNIQTRTITTIYDGETVDIDAPPDTVFTGTNYTPEATVKNSSGRGYADFSVTCTITPVGYTSTRNLTGLAAGATTQVLFASWTSPLAAGVTYTMTVTCQTTGDNNTANNTKTKSIFAYGDVGVFEAHYPVDEVYVDTDIYPTVMLRNFTAGTTEGFDVTIQVEDEGGSIVYEDVTATEGMAPNQDQEFYFPTAWHTPNEVGKHFILHAFTALPGDCKPTNDQTDWEVVTVAKPGTDVRPKSIDSPNSASSGAVYTPKATVENPGTNPASFWTFCTIDAGLFKASYIDSVLVDNLKAGDNQALTFKDWTAEAGTYTLRVITALTGDEHPENDTATLQLTSTGINESSELIPTVFSLQSSRPNPFYNTTEIRYGLPKTSRISLAIYDITGKLVKTLANGTERCGYHTLTWNGADNSGKRLSAGLYFIRFEAPFYTTTAKLILVR